MGAIVAGAARYRAFISYSHADQKQARWLQRALESYRVPARLVGRETATGVIEKRVGAIFRDRDELPVAADLSGEINQALEASQFLIVLCSPKSAASKWVNQEVINFKRLKGASSIIAVIVAGEPGAAEPGQECFCPGLRFQVGADGTLSDTPAEPIAADLRPGKDQPRLVKMKVLAGLLGVGLDELIRRDNARRQRLLSYALAASVAGLMTMAGLTWSAVTARKEAEHQKAAADRQRGQAEDLIEFMLGDLRKKLQPVGRLDVLDSVGEKALGYFATLQPDEVDADTLGRRSRALHLIGETQDLRGNLDAALKAFAEARETTAALLARDPANGQRMFDQGQSAYWIGYVNRRRGDSTGAREAFTEYQRLSLLLMEKNPESASWREEAAYSYMSTGALSLEEHRFDDAAEDFRRGRALFAPLVSQAKPDSGLRLHFGQFDAWLADSYRGAGQLDRAKDARREELDIYAEVLKDDPLNKMAAQYTVVSLFSLGRITLEQGNLKSAAGYLEDALARAQTLTAGDPDNVRWAELEARANLELGECALATGDTAGADRHAAKATQIAARLVARDPTVVTWQTGLRLRAQMLTARIALDRRNAAGARRVAADIIAALETLRRSQPKAADISWLAAQAHLTDGDAALLAGAKTDAVASWTTGADAAAALLESANLQEKLIYLSLLERLGRKDEAITMASQLQRIGARQPDAVGLFERLGMSSESK